MALGLGLLLPHWSKRNATWFLALSPACFLYECNNGQAFRKELLGLVVLATLCWCARSQPLRLTKLWTAMSVAFPCLILCHEAFIVLVAYF